MISTLSQFIAQCETNNVAHALRFEPNWRWTLQADIDNCIRSHKPAYMNATTAKTILAMSWGRHQIMGANLYALGYKGTMAQFLADDLIQEAWFTEFVRSRGIKFSLEEILTNTISRSQFAKKYNGSVEHYTQRMRDVAQQFGLEMK